MSTFLEIANDTRRECGISGADLTTLVGVSGESLRVKEWVAQSWVEIQEENSRFNFLRQPISFQSVANQQAYTPDDAVPTGLALTDFSEWDLDSFRCYLTATGVADEALIHKMDYKIFRDTYIFGTARTTYQKPANVTERPNDQALLLGYAPDAIYTVVGEYFRTPVELSADADTPAMPSKFHNIIMYRAMQSYALYEAAPEVMTRGQSGYARMIRGLRASQLQPMDLGGALV